MLLNSKKGQFLLLGILISRDSVYARFHLAVILFRPERWPSGLRRWSRTPVWDFSHRGFESHSLRQQNGEMLEWTNRRDWKSRVSCKGNRGFESHSLRQKENF